MRFSKVILIKKNFYYWVKILINNILYFSKYIIYNYKFNSYFYFIKIFRNTHNNHIEKNLNEILSLIYTFI